MTDGGVEDRMYLNFDRDGRFGLTRWYQDETPPIQPNDVGEESPETLILKCINGYEEIRTRDLEDPYFPLRDLAKGMVEDE